MKKSLLSISLLINAAFLTAQTWKQTGPVNFPINVSPQINGLGRVTQLKFHPSSPDIMLATSAGGGLYRTTDRGTTWSLMNTDKFPPTACASVCIDHTDDRIIYLSTGDPNYYSAHFGIYKTTDGGNTWAPSNNGIGNRMALEMLMDPADHQVIVAVTNNGIWRTVNGGNSWTNVLNGGNFLDLKQRANSNTLYAVTYSQFWRSTDFGITWTQISSGLNIPAGTNGLRLAVSAANNNIVYLLANGGNGVLFKSVNAGLDFNQVYSSNTQCIVCYTDDPADPGQGNYNLAMTADPFNAQHVYVAAQCLWESNDGGTSFEQKTVWYDELHTDHHQVEINPYNGSELWNVNDGGVWKRLGTNDSLWEPKSDGIVAMEIYHAGQSPVSKNYISIGTQDNGELYYDAEWKTNRGGDWGSRVFFDYSPRNTIYYMENGRRRTLKPYSSSLGFNIPFNPNNNARMAFHPSEPGLAILAKDTVFLSQNIDLAQPAWTNIYPTTSAVRDLCISSADAGIAFIIYNNSSIVRISNLLTAPVATTIITPGLTTIRASVATVKNNLNVVYLSGNNRVFRSADQGNTWEDVTANLPATPVLKICHDDFSTNETMYVCTGNRVFTKSRSETNWTEITGNLPSIATITDFMLYNNGNISSLLRVSYYGRGVWEYPLHPDYPPVADFTADKNSICPGQSVQFTNTSEGDNLTYNWNFTGGNPATSSAENPLVTYAAAGVYPVQLTVTNANGTVVKTADNFIIVSYGSPQLVNEGFQGNSFPPSGWTIDNDGYTVSDYPGWYQYNYTGGFGTSTRSAAFNNYVTDVEGKHIQLRLPVTDLTQFSSAKLTFDVAYAPYSTTEYLDSLLVGVSADCGASFNYLYTKYGASLATAPIYEDAPFEPLPGQWRKETIDLNGYLGHNSLMIAIENRGHYGQQVFIDNVNLELKPKAEFSADNSNICPGTIVHFTDLSSGLVSSRQWNFAGGNPASSNAQNVSVEYSAPGTYDVSLTVSNGSGSQVKTRSGYITVLAAPVPVITAVNNLLKCSVTGTAYEWYYNNSPVAGATGQTLQVNRNGDYKVIVKDANGCTASSGVFKLTVFKDELLVYPNPANERLYVIGNNINGFAYLELLTASGQRVLYKSVDNIAAANEIDMRRLPAGVYTLKVTTNGMVLNKKIIHNLQ